MSRLDNRYMDLSVKFCPWPSSEELVVLLISLVLGNKGFKDDTNCYRLPSLLFFDPLSLRVSYIIYPFLVDLGPSFVDHAGYFLSACPINRLPKPSMSCSN